MSDTTFTKVNDELTDLLSGGTANPDKAVDLALEAVSACGNHSMNDRQAAALLGLALTLCGATMDIIVTNARQIDDTAAWLRARAYVGQLSQPVGHLVTALLSRSAGDRGAAVIAFTFTRIAKIMGEVMTRTAQQ